LEFFIAIIQLITLDFSGFVESLNKAPIIFSWFLFLIFCLILILILLKLFGEVGMYIYTVLAIIGANIQVLKLVEFPFFSNPIALGTILFSSTFLATDILSEYYGIKFARKNILIGFISFLIFTIFMLFTMGFTPLDPGSTSDQYSWAIPLQDNLTAIFMPFPTFFIASMIAYLVSQYFDVWFYAKLSLFTKNKLLWLRNNISTMISSLMDNTIFSIFAWIILNPEPLDFNTVLFTFILGTYFLRIIIAILDTPFIYLARNFLPKNTNV
jgi:uncharacterized integral membrane protein (TIGR00697 family)|tara:strand:- start:519 stop:1325 length:807 start_codon:yes stop_codon:yes gene_type:complete